MRWTEQQLADYLEKTGVAGRPNTADTSAPPFAVPSDIILDLPVPPSVNRLRRIDWAKRDVARAWVNVADAYIIVAKGRTISPLRLRKLSRFELLIVLSEHHTKIDLDNSLKSLIDYLKRIEIIEDDGPKHMRRLTVEWGLAPHGCRVTVRACA
jgi:Holliday junction resolvase RusA-like endonuclease